jgi:hypothetical protein
MKFLPPFLILALIIGAESACSRSSNSMPPELREALRTWNTEIAEKTVEDVLPRYQARTDDEIKLANSFAVQTISTARLAKAVEARWGRVTETQAMHLCFTDTPEDDSAATVTVHGDHATLNFGRLQLAPLYLVKTNGVWYFDMAQYVNAYGPRLNSILKYCDRSSEAIDKMTATINSGQILSSKDAITALSTALPAVNAQ